jgi:hypothetical protein
MLKAIMFVCIHDAPGGFTVSGKTKGNNKGIEEKENSNFDSHTIQEAINFFQVPSILEGS